MPVYRGPGGAGDATNDATVTAVQAAATSAATSATNAANSATAAATSASGAATSATNAANSATTAAGSVTTAAGHANSASTYATNSALSADDSADYALESQTYASQAFDSATEASSSASAASTSATNAGTSATNASNSAASALAIYGNTTAMNAAVASATASASSASTSASTATTQASNAASSASTATTQAGLASTSATNANNSAVAASLDANEAQAAAIAAQSAVNNAEAIYGSLADIQQAEANSEANRDAAAASATSASNSASTATTQAGIATTQANNAAVSAAAASAVALGNEPVRHSVRPSLLLDFANTKQLDPRITFTRASTASFYDGKTTVKAEENLIPQSQFASGWSPSNCTLTLNTTTSPDGTTTASTLTATASAGSFFTNPAISILANSNYTVSMFVKQGTGTWVLLNLWAGSANNGVSLWINTSTGALGTSSATSGYSVTSSSTTSVGNGWYRVSLTGQATSAGSIYANIRMVDGDNAFTFATVNGLTTFIWGAQLEQRSSVTAYTPTTAAAITNYIPALQSAASGVARFDHNPTTGESLGLEIEEQRTNLVTYSSDFSNAAWSKNAVTITTTANIGPDGTQTAQLVVPTTGSASKYLQTAGTYTANTYTFSIYVKYYGIQYFWASVDSSVTAIYFDLINGGIAATGAGNTGTITSVGNGWYRCTVTKTTASSTAMLFGFSTTSTSYTMTGNAYSGGYMWGAQLEAGAFATSYIPTVASQVTRSADSASMTGTNFSSWYRADEGTLYNEAVPSAIGAFRLSSISDGTTANRVLLSTTSSTSNAFVTAFGANIVDIYSGTATANTTLKQAFAYRANDFAISGNSATVATDLSGAVPSVNQLQIGAGQAGANSLNGTIKKLAYYPKRLQNSELVALTTI